MSDRPADIVRALTDSVMAPRVPAEDAVRVGHMAYDKPPPDNSIMLFIDHQIGLMAGVRDFTSLAEYRSDIVGLARTAKALKMPVMVSSSNAQWQNGDTLPELKEIFADQPIYRRTGIINGHEDPSFRTAFEELVQKTGRRHVIISECASCRSRPISVVRTMAEIRRSGCDSRNGWRRSGRRRTGRSTRWPILIEGD